MKFWLTVGRYQPLHKGHIALINTKLDKGKNVLVFIRDTGQDEDNPYSFQQRADMFYKEFASEIKSGRLLIAPVSDIEGIFSGS